MKGINRIMILIGSFMIAVAGTLSMYIHFEGLGRDNHVNDMGPGALVFFILFFVLSFFLLPVVFGMADKLLSKVSGEDPYKEKKLTSLIPWAVIGIIVYIPYFLSFYPGGIWADTFASIHAGKEGILTNRHPFLYNLGIGLIVKLGELLGFDMTRTCALLTLVQIVMCLAAFLYFAYWMMDKGIDRILRFVILAVLFVCPIFPLYGISVWKDTPYSLGMMLFMMWSYDLYREVTDDKSGMLKLSVYIRFLAGAFLVAFLRNNGKYIIALTFIFWIIIFVKHKTGRKYLIGLIAFLLGVFIIQGPVYDLAGVKATDTVEKYAIPLQQICAVVSKDGNISPEQLDVVKGFVSIEDIKEHYNPVNADDIKWSESFDDEYLKGHQGEFLKLWASLFPGNPGVYLHAYLLNTCCFWDVGSDPDTDYAYVQTGVWNNFYNVESKDLWERIFGFSIAGKLMPRDHINGAVLVWIFILSAIYMIGRMKQPLAVTIVLPLISMWLTVMIATPIAVSFRYISPMLFCLPVLVTVLILLSRGNAR